MGQRGHMARDGTWVLVATGGLDPNPDLDPVGIPDEVFDATLSRLVEL